MDIGDGYARVFNSRKKVKLESIQVSKEPTKTNYYEGEKFDKNGMEVTAKYSDGTSKVITDYSYSPIAELSEENTTITITYTEDNISKQTTQAVKVNKKTEEQGQQAQQEKIQNNKKEKEDSTTAKGKLPKTGLSEIIALIGIYSIIVLAVMFIRYREINK